MIVAVTVMVVMYHVTTRYNIRLQQPFHDANVLMRSHAYVRSQARLFSRAQLPVKLVQRRNVLLLRLHTRILRADAL